MYSNSFHTIPTVVKNLLIINGLIYFGSLLLVQQDIINLNTTLGLWSLNSESFRPHQLITYMFLHDYKTFTHILFNMFAVWMFGRVLEGVWGQKRFLIFYIVTGVGAGITQLLVCHFTNSYSVTVGASGSVFGILLAFGMLFPNTRLMLLFPPIPIKAKFFVLGYGALELFLGLSNNPGDSVAHFAHLGGMIFGLLILRVWKKQNNLY